MSQPRASFREEPCCRRRHGRCVGRGGHLAARRQCAKPMKRPRPRSRPAKGGGYQLTEHVKQYYKSTLI
jgi:hypothetical protein